MAGLYTPRTRVSDAVMATSTQSNRRQMYRLAIGAAFLAGIVLAVLLTAPSPAGAQAGMELEELNVTGANETIDGNVTDLTLGGEVSYQYDVPDATQRVITLRAGPNAADLDTVAYRVADEPAPQDTGTLLLSGSVIDETSLTAADIDPARAATERTQIVVQAVIEIQRENGDVVERRVTDTATVALTDDNALTASIGGTADLRVETEA